MKNLFAAHPLPWTVADGATKDFVVVKDANGVNVELVTVRTDTAEQRKENDEDVTVYRKVPKPAARAKAALFARAGAMLGIIKGFVDDFDNDDRTPQDAGCLDCTAGTTPNDRNTGPCFYHRAEALLKALGAADDADPASQPPAL